MMFSLIRIVIVAMILGALTATAMEGSGQQYCWFTCYVTDQSGECFFAHVNCTPADPNKSASVVCQLRKIGGSWVLIPPPGHTVAQCR